MHPLLLHETFRKGSLKSQRWLPKQIWKKSLSIHHVHCHKWKPQPVVSKDSKCIFWCVKSAFLFHPGLRPGLPAWSPAHLEVTRMQFWWQKFLCWWYAKCLRWFEHILLCNSWCEISAKSFCFMFSSKCCLWCSWTVTSCLRFLLLLPAWGTVFQMKQGRVGFCFSWWSSSMSKTHLPISWERLKQQHHTEAFPPAWFFLRCYQILLFGVS